MGERCEHYRPGVKTALWEGCELRGGCTAARAALPEECLDYWRARAEKAKRELDRVHKALATMQKHEQQHLKTPCTCDGFEVCAQLLEAALAQGEGENEQV